MTPYYADDRITLYHGDCLDLLPTLPDCSVDSVCTDPPYGLEFMGKDWDKFKSVGRDDLRHVTRMDTAPQTEQGNPWASERKSYGSVKKNPRCKRCQRLKHDHEPRRCQCAEPEWDLRITESMHQYQDWCQLWAAECLRVLKPGGFLLAFGGTRTSHRLTCAIEDTGFEIRDSIAWMYGSGFPKSLNPYRSIMGACPNSADAPHVVRISRFIPVPSSAAKEPTALALARIQPGDAPVLLTETGGAAGSSVRTATLLSALAERMNLSTDLLWSVLWAANSDPANMCTTLTTSRTTTVSAILSSLPSKITPANTTWDHNLPPGCSCAAFAAGLGFSGISSGSNVIPVLTAPGSASGGPLEPLDKLGTSTKPAYEPITVARKPLVGTVAANILQYGTGALNIAATRIGSQLGSFESRPGDNSDCTCPSREGDRTNHTPSTQHQPSSAVSLAGRNGLHSNGVADAHGSSEPPGFQGDYPSSPRSDGGPLHQAGVDGQAFAQQRGDAHELLGPYIAEPHSPRKSMPCPHHTATRVEGRWPANVVLDSDAAAELDQQSGELKSPASYERNSVGFNNETAYGKFDDQRTAVHSYGDTGGASRFFYTAKASTDERIRHDGTSHPTVKPLSLMRWLVKLVTQPGGVVLDPFAGSGTTVEACILEGFRCIAVERETPYLPLITQRINRRLDPVAYLEASGDDLGLFGEIA